MAFEEISELEENIRILVDAELEVQHVLGDHDAPAPACPRCQRHPRGRYPQGSEKHPPATDMEGGKRTRARRE